MISSTRKVPQTIVLSVLAAAAFGMVLGGCTPGPRERTMAARQAVVSAQSGSTDVVYFEVLEDLPRKSAANPTTTSVSAVWLHGN